MKSAARLDADWNRYLVGGGTLEPSGAALRLVTENASTRTYSDAQIDDYQGLPRRRFRWRPPLRLTLEARFSPGLRGTAGFGFWNDPFLMTGARVPTLPRAVWFFFASPPSNIKLDLATPGHGWKAATIDALRPSALLLAPLAPLLIPLFNLDRVYHALWPPIQRALRIAEASLPLDMTAWHAYSLVWERARARFSVSDGRGTPHQVLDAPAPGGPLGFVLWLDNQYLIATPWGRFQWGLLDVPSRQWMEIRELSIEAL